MPLCSASAELVNSGYTVVDNAFIAEYMPQSPSGCAEIYLFGLYLCSQPNKQHNTMEVMCRALGLKEEDVINGFAYWEEMGLVHVVQKEPIEVVYLSQKTSHALLKNQGGKILLLQQADSGRNFRPHDNGAGIQRVLYVSRNRLFPTRSVGGGGKALRRA